jgi:transposase-like protein
MTARKKYSKEFKLDVIERMTLGDTITEYRRRLHDISWLMRNLNENIARVAKKEDDRTSRS